MRQKQHKKLKLSITLLGILNEGKTKKTIKSGQNKERNEILQLYQ